MKQKQWTFIASGLGFAAALMFALTATTTNQTTALAQSSDASDASPADNEAVRVEVSKPTRRSLDQSLELPASLEPGEVADLFAKASGYVSKLHVDIGGRVEKGDSLVRIDIPEMDDELRQAEAILAAKEAKVRALRAKVNEVQSMIVTARAEVQRKEAQLSLGRITSERKKQLYDEKAIPEQDLDEAMSRLAVMEAEVEIAQANVEARQAEKSAVEADVAVAESQVAVEESRLARIRTLMSYATVRAPFDGVITERLVDPGAFVRSAEEGATTPLLTLARVDYLRLVMHVPESDAPHISVGARIEARCAQFGSEPIRATVTRTAMALRESTRTMRVEADIDNPNGRLMPGLYARASVLLESESQVMMIPSKAIRVRGRDVSVLVADEGVARARPITLGYDDGIWAEVSTGLTGSEHIIVSAGGVVAPGAPVAATQSGL